MNIQSNAIRGKFLYDIMDTTVNEIHDNLVTVFGPGATDAYITKNNQPYYTRDGKEVLSSMLFDNSVSNYILKMIYQAVYDQGKSVGDGTTTLAILYTNLYQNIRNDYNYVRRNEWNDLIQKLNENIKKLSHPMTDEDLKCLLVTCTQDVDLAYKIYENLREPILNHAYITINKSNINEDFQMTVHNSPVFKVTKQFSVKPVKDHEDACTIFHCNGILDIAHMEVILDLMSRVQTSGDENGLTRYYPKTIILLCNGVSNATREMTKKLVQFLNSQKDTVGLDLSTYNNVAIYTLDEYRSYSNEQLEDISTLITDEPGIGGLVNQLTFESLLYQALGNPDNTIQELMTFDCDIHHIDKIRQLFAENYAIDFDEILGMRIHKELGPVAKARYEELKKEIEEEKSEVKQVALRKRLQTMYGQFIDVEVGSKLIKDSQRKYELILDAVLAASEGVEHGVLDANSLLVTLNELYMNSVYSDNPYTMLLENSLQDTLCDMIGNCFDLNHNMTTHQSAEFIKWIIGNKDLAKFDLNAEYFNDILPKKDDESIQQKLYTAKDSDGNIHEIPAHIVEPVSVITTMLENSTLIVELAQAKTLHVDNFIGNYLETINYDADVTE